MRHNVISEKPEGLVLIKQFLFLKTDIRTTQRKYLRLVTTFFR